VDNAPTRQRQRPPTWHRRRVSGGSRPPARATWLSGWALLPLRAFLGVTFCFAGLQKLANPNFFNTSDPAGIYAQMIAAERFSPLHALLGHLLRFSTPVGVIIALGELAVGLGVLLGLFTRVAAIGGAIISLSLFLTVSYATSPYYTGADIVFAFAWTPLVVAGSGGVLSLDALIAGHARAARRRGPATPVAVPFSLVQRICGNFDDGTCGAMDGAPCDAGPCPFLRVAADPAPERQRGDLTRRDLMFGAAASTAAGVAGMVAAGAAAGIGRAVGGAKPPPAPVSLSPTKPTTSTPTTTAASSSSSTSTTAAARRPAGTAIGPAKDVPVGGWAGFTDPKTRLPSLVIQLEAGRFVAYDAVCPHEGCTVAYVPSQSIIACPCHGSEFNPDTGAVIQGPAPHGLGRLGIAEGPDGQLYVSG
jgi:thiosulfate dehydrogenase (quinone) large subunit